MASVYRQNIIPSLKFQNADQDPAVECIQNMSGNRQSVSRQNKRQDPIGACPALCGTTE